MSHLILKKLPNGKYRIYNKTTKKLVGSEMADREKATQVLKTRDAREDKEE